MRGEPRPAELALLVVSCTDHTGSCHIPFVLVGLHLLFKWGCKQGWDCKDRG
jgi:hypothetical protein